ncbi:MAG: hypothetical protein AAF581_05400 [Planctomycetota bacterium]
MERQPHLPQGSADRGVTHPELNLESVQSQPLLVWGALVLIAVFGCVFPNVIAAQPPAGENAAEDNAGADDETGTDEDSDESSLDDVPKRLTEGKVSVIEFLKYIHKRIGLLVDYPSTGNDPQFSPDTMINVLGDVEPLNYEIVKSLLEANGYTVTHEILNDAERTQVVHVSHAGSRAQGASGVPTVTEIHDIDSELPTDEFADERYATLVLQLKHTETQVVIQALRELTSVGGGGGNRSAGGNTPIVQLPDTRTLIIKGKVDLLRHLQDLVKYIDVEVRPPEGKLRIVEVYNATAEDIVSVISEILNIQGQGGRTPTRNNRAARSGRGNQANQNAPRAPTDPGEYTRLIADSRTEKIIIDTTDEEQLDTILRLIDDLDVKVENLRPNTHHYEVKFLKASDLAEDIRSLVEGTRSSGSTLRGRQNRGGRGNTANQQQQQQQLATRIVPHDDTNSLLIQAEYAEYVEILRVLEGIDRKRKQVFLEAALVQVTEGSDLNYTLEYLAGDLDETATRVAALTSFGLSTPVFGTATDPSALAISRTITGAGSGLLAAVSDEGQLPVLLRAIKTDSDTKILATPFILADDNETSDISSTDTIYFETTTSTNTGTSTGQGTAEAGISLSLTPTISENVVLINLAMSVSSFGAQSSGTGGVPDRSENTINSQVTVADGDLFIIGGLARESDGVSVSKVPILGDLPLLGWLFQSKASTKSRNNLYIFLNAHILRSDDFSELRNLSRQARGTMQDTFNSDVNIQFKSPNRRDESSRFDDESERR